jgi:hypothetical protein
MVLDLSRSASAMFEVHDELTGWIAEVNAQARFPAEGMTVLAHGGFYGLCLDTQFGGHGQGPATFAAVVVVVGELNNPLTYLGVIRETAYPGLGKVCIRVYPASPEEQATIQCLWQKILATSPLVRTFQAAIQPELSLQMVV